MNVLSLFRAIVERHADAVAIEYDAFDDDAPARPAVSYDELERRSNQLARCLFGQGVVPGMPVVILAEDTTVVVTAMLAILKAGAAFVPIDARLPPARISAMLELVQPALVLVESAISTVLTRLDLPAAKRPTVLSLDTAETLAERIPGWPLCAKDWQREPTDTFTVDVAPDAFCYIFFTSGSTGVPKAIAGRLKAIDHFIRWEIETFGVGPGTRVSQLATPSFDAYLRDIFTPLCAGGTVCVPVERERVLAPGELAAWIEIRRIHLVHCVPTVFRLLLDDPGPADAMPELRWILLAGETVTPNDVSRWTQFCGERIRLANLYGPSETTMTKFCHQITVEDGTRRSVPIGRPIPGASAMVVDAEGEPCPHGTTGEILIRTPYRTLGYYKRPDLTAEVFIPSPRLEGDSEDLVYRTGDLGRVMEDGSFELIGRKDSQIKIRGIRVEPAEIEDRLRSMPGVTDAAVVARLDKWNAPALSAYVVAHGEPAATELRNWLAQVLPSVMIPATFVLIPALPRTITGKVDRNALLTIDPNRRP